MATTLVLMPDDLPGLVAVGCDVALAEEVLAPLLSGAALAVVLAVGLAATALTALLGVAAREEEVFWAWPDLLGEAIAAEG